MSAGGIAALIAAGAFVVLVLVLAVPILKLGRTVDEATRLVSTLNERTGPMLTNLDGTVRGVNGQLERVDGITTNAQAVSSNVAALTSLFAATLGTPIVKVAAFSYGVRKAASGRRRRDAGRIADLVSARGNREVS